jgi:flagellar biosynthetic protein FliR
MPTEVSIPVALVHSFLLVLARVGSVMIYVPLPGATSAVTPVRAILVLAATMALYPMWPVITVEPSLAQYTAWLATEAGFGLCIGLLVGFNSDAFLFFGQLAGFQAGYSFASTIDPSTEADSPVLSVIAQLLAGLLFVTFGLHRIVIRIFATSLTTHPLGVLTLDRNWTNVLIHAASTIFSTGLRLALPVIALLIMVDLTLALLSRINSQLQLLSLAFPIKMLLALVTVSTILVLFPSVYSSLAERMLSTASRLVR